MSKTGGGGGGRSSSSASSSAHDDESEATTRQHLRGGGAVPEAELEEQHRQAIREDQHFVGFYNATLFRSDERDITLFTEGLRGCTGFILTGPEGTYMAHIFSGALGGAHSDDVSNLTKAVIATYESNIGSLPDKAIIVTDKEADVHVGMRNALSETEFDQEHEYLIGPGFAIKVGQFSRSCKAP